MNLIILTNIFLVETFKQHSTVLKCDNSDLFEKKIYVSKNDKIPKVLNAIQTLIAIRNFFIM